MYSLYLIFYFLRRYYEGPTEWVRGFYFHQFIVAYAVRWARYLFINIYFYLYVCIIGLLFYFILLNYLIPWIKYLLNLWKKEKFIFINLIILLYKFWDKKKLFQKYLTKIFLKKKKKVKRKKIIKKIFNRLISFLKNVSK